MLTPIYGEIFSISDGDRTVRQVNYTFEADVIEALAAFFSDARVTSVPMYYGTYTFRMYTSERTGIRAPILVLTEDQDDEKVYFTGDHNILQELSESLVDNLDDLLEKPRNSVGGQRRTKQSRTKQARRGCGPCGGCGPCERMLHKHTPLSRRTRKYKHTRKSKRARRTQGRGGAGDARVSRKK